MFVSLLKVIGIITRDSTDFIENSGTKIYLNAEKTSQQKKIFANACWVLFDFFLVNGLNLINAQKKKQLCYFPNEVLKKQISHGTVVPNQDWGYIDKNSGRN